MAENSGLGPDFDSFFDFDSFDKPTQEIRNQQDIDGILRQLRPVDIVRIDEEYVYVPGIILPGLTKQPSISTSATIAKDITDAADEAQVQPAIDAINKELEKFYLYWDITPDPLAPNTIFKKLKKNNKYLRNTLYGIWNLKLGADLATIKSTSKNPDIEGAETLIIDYSNLKIGLQKDCSSPRKIDGSLAKDIAFVMSASKCSRIIISIQSNDKGNRDFKEFRTELKRIYGIDNVIVIVGSDASSFDDLNIAYIVTQILPKSIKHIITSDKFRDLQRLELDPTTGELKIDEITGKPIKIPIFPPKSSDPKMKMISVDVFCSPLLSTTPGLIESGTARAPMGIDHMRAPMGIVPARAPIGIVHARAPMGTDRMRAPMAFVPVRAPMGIDHMRAHSHRASLHDARSSYEHRPSRPSSSDTRRDSPSRRSSSDTRRDSPSRRSSSDTRPHYGHSSYVHSLEHRRHLSHSPSRRSSSATHDPHGRSYYSDRDGRSDGRSDGHHSSRRSRSPSRRGHRGGTIKYKKSLLNKRTRKIYKKNYSHKMKKYSKNKKKKTLRRIRL
jgi:hypothetical protein